MFSDKYLSLLIITAIMNSGANLLIKKASTKFIIPSSIRELVEISILNIPFFFGLCLFAVSLLFYAYLLSKVNLSIIYPILVSINFIIVNFGAFYLFNEKFEIFQFIGIIIIIIGIWLVSLAT